jgi:hypothetical protein
MPREVLEQMPIFIMENSYAGESVYFIQTTGFVV